MNKTKIEWCDYTINPVKGLCPMACPYCYARRLYDRFKWNPEIHYLSIDAVAKDIYKIDNRRGAVGENAKIFVGSTMELFGEWVNPEYLRQLFAVIKSWSEHTFIFLTKQPQNLPREFPSNCWVGVSPITNGQLLLALVSLEKIEAKVKFVSIEPMRNELDAFKFAVKDNVIDWVIIGQQTPVKKATMPKIEWVREIVEACNTAGIPVFLKNNLLPIFKEDIEADGYNQLFFSGTTLRQEFPCV